MVKKKFRFILYEGQRTLKFHEPHLKIHLYFEWRGGVRSGRYILNKVKKCYAPLTCEIEEFPDNWRLSPNDQKLIIEKQNKK
jgi:hypothetical protein